MKSYILRSFSDFVAAIKDAGFSGDKEVFSVMQWNFAEGPPYDTPVRWFTGDPETDPWEWRARVTEENTGISYGKVFFRKMGFISSEWAPYFLAARRRQSFAEAYGEGKLSLLAKRLYEMIAENEAVPAHVLKKELGIGKAEKSAFERTLVELEMGMFITHNGRQQKISKQGVPYSWTSAVFSTAEHFWGEDVILHAESIDAADAEESITARVFELNPKADPVLVRKFIRGK